MGIKIVNDFVPRWDTNHEGYRAIFNAALAGICANPNFSGPTMQGSPQAAVDFANEVTLATIYGDAYVPPHDRLASTGGKSDESSMREKIARAIFEAWASDGNSDASWEELRLMSKRDGYSRAKSIYALAFKEADAVLDALMEPTEGVLRAGDKVLCEEVVCNCDEREIFRAMIQAAKDGK